MDARNNRWIKYSDGNGHWNNSSYFYRNRYGRFSSDNHYFADKCIQRGLANDRNNRDGTDRKRGYDSDTLTNRLVPYYRCSNCINRYLDRYNP